MIRVPVVGHDTVRGSFFGDFFPSRFYSLPTILRPQSGQDRLSIWVQVRVSWGSTGAVMAVPAVVKSISCLARYADGVRARIEPKDSPTQRRERSGDSQRQTFVIRQRQLDKEPAPESRKDEILPVMTDRRGSAGPLGVRRTGQDGRRRPDKVARRRGTSGCRVQNITNHLISDLHNPPGLYSSSHHPTVSSQHTVCCTSDNCCVRSDTRCLYLHIERPIFRNHLFTVVRH